MKNIKCPMCDGDGVVDCPTCDGRYSLRRFLDDITGDEHEICPNCNNTFKVTCNNCGGTGRVIEED